MFNGPPLHPHVDEIRLEATDVATVRVELIGPSATTVERRQTTASESTSTATTSAPARLDVAMVDNLRRRLEPRLADLRRGVDWEQTDDPVEALRRTRIATRRLRSFTELFEPMIGRERAKPLRKRLRTIARGIGPLRDWDALISLLLTEHAKAEPLGQAALEMVLVWAREQRESEVPRARKVIAKGQLYGLADELDEELDRVCGQVMRLDDGLRERLVGLLAPILDLAMLNMPFIQDSDGLEALHDARLRAKRWRYAVEMLEPLAGSSFCALRRPAKRMQRALGQHRDSSALHLAVERHVSDFSRRGLPTLSNALFALQQQSLERQASALRRARKVAPEPGRLRLTKVLETIQKPNDHGVMDPPTVSATRSGHPAHQRD
ncbi:MAG: CHAD domain-containing protein [Nannocystaceae bacterium]